MAMYVGEEEVWKCPKHPSKRRRNGICPTCLRDRLGSLCPDCHVARPCACACLEPSSSSSSSSSSDEPSFHRSRSVAVTFFRFKNSVRTPNSSRAKTPSFLSLLKRNNTKRSAPEPPPVLNINSSSSSSKEENCDSHNRIEDFARMVTKSRSVSGGTTSAMASGLFRRGDVGSSPAKGKFWHFPSPMKAFRSSKSPKIVV